MRAWVVAGALTLGACSSPLTGSDYELGQRWLIEAPLRRQVLQEALVSWDNGYAQLRLSHYDEAGWGARPEWRPQVAAVRTGTTTPGAWVSAVLEVADTEPAWVEQGAHAFTSYPVQIVPELRAALADPEACGLEVGPDGVIEGIVWVQLPDGPQPALTCAACHAGGEGAGRSNAKFDLQAILSGRCGSPSRWGPGRVDVTADGVDNPTAIPDLRPVGWQGYLHRAGTLANSRLALAMRTETLIITSLSGAVRPPREVALGLAWWMWSLKDSLPEVAPDPQAEGLYRTHCEGCHAGVGQVGGLWPIEQVGTDLAVLNSPDRRTGLTRVPSLRGLPDRGLLFSGGAAPSFEAWWQGEVQVEGHLDPRSLGPETHAVLGAYLGRR